MEDLSWWSNRMKVPVGDRTPPSNLTVKEGEIFKSPTSSISAESGIDLKYFAQLPKLSITDPDGSFTETGSFTNVNIKSEFDKTAWETVYAIQEGRKLVKPTFQGAVYNFLERPREWRSISYHCFIFAACLVCLLVSVLNSVLDGTEGGDATAVALFYMEAVLVVILTSEYLARLWSAGCRSKYLGFWGRFRFVTKPISVIDLVVILASFFVLILGSSEQNFAVSAIRGVRFLQILRMLHMDRQGGSWRLLGSVIAMHRQELLTSLYIGFLGLMFSSYFMYLVEEDIMIGDKKSEFTSYADALWWGVVTMMTIGYGDKVPHTWTGRALACLSAMFTVSFFALPAGILGSGFALKVQQKQRQKHFSRQIPAAATLIQCLWRCYAADKKFCSVATWEMYLKHNIPPSPSKSKALGMRLRRLKNKDPERQTYGNHNGRSKSATNAFGDIVVLDLAVPRAGLLQSRSVPDMIAMQEEEFYSIKKDADKMSNNVFRSPQGGESTSDILSEESFCDQQYHITALTETHKNAVRAIRKIKYFVAKRKFQQTRKPYDVGDVIEQYSQGHLSMMVRIKELQRRIDQILGKPGAFSGDSNGKPITVGNKLNHLDLQMQRLDNKIDNIVFRLDTLFKDISSYHKFIEDVQRKT